MSKTEQCQGCGAYLQSDDPQQLGYLPPQHATRADKICQRCFRIANYGQDELGAVSGSAAIQIVEAAVNWADGVILLLDLMDFDASLTQDFVRLLRGRPVIAAINKGDLLPPKTSWQEAELWARQRLLASGIQAQVEVISASVGKGLDRLVYRLEHSNWEQIAIIGATNVGKSTLVTRLLEAIPDYNGKKPTMSRFPGTTVNRIEWSLPNGHKLLDTPGIVPADRLSDQVCASCAIRLIPEHKLNPKIYALAPNLALTIPGLCAVEYLGSEKKGTIMGYTASELTWHRANSNKLDQWLTNSCNICEIGPFQTHELTLKRNHDLSVFGLGWISIRKHDAKLRLTIPRGVGYAIRPNLVGPKDFS